MGTNCSCPEQAGARPDPEASLDKAVAITDDTPLGEKALSELATDGASSSMPDETPSHVTAEPVAGELALVEEAKATPLVESKEPDSLPDKSQEATTEVKKVDKVIPESKTKAVPLEEAKDLKGKPPRKEPLPKVDDHHVRNAEEVRNALKVLCRRHGLCCSIVYKLDKRNSILYVDKDESYAGTASDFYDKSLSCSGSLHIGEGVVGRVWANKSKELVANVGDLDEKKFPRKEIALMNNIRSVFAIYLQEVVYEFDTNQLLSAFPFETFGISELHAEYIEKRKHHHHHHHHRHHLRPTFDDLENYCGKHGLCCCVVWKLQAGLLVVDSDESYDGTAFEFVEASEKFKMRVGQGVVGRVWASKTIEHHSNVQGLTQTVYPRLDVAKRYNIRTTFAIFHHDRVYEFSTPKQLAGAPFKTLEATTVS